MWVIAAIAKSFFGCARGRKGLVICTEWCGPEATFSVQAEPLVEIRTLRYTEWTKDFERLRLPSFLLPSRVGR